MDYNNNDVVTATITTATCLPQNPHANYKIQHFPNLPSAAKSVIHEGIVPFKVLPLNCKSSFIVNNETTNIINFLTADGQTNMTKFPQC